MWASMKQASTGAKTGKVDFTETSFPPSSPNWNALNFSTAATPISILDLSGVDTGWDISMIADPGAEYFEYEFGAIPATTNFQADILRSSFFVENTSNLAFTIAGLNPAKTYDLNAGFPVRPGADWVYIKTQVWSGSSGGTSTVHDIGLVSASVEDIYTGLIPRSDGVLILNATSSSGYLINLGGLIIKEN